MQLYEHPKALSFELVRIRNLHDFQKVPLWNVESILDFTRRYKNRYLNLERDAALAITYLHEKGLEEEGIGFVGPFVIIKDMFNLMTKPSLGPRYKKWPNRYIQNYEMIYDDPNYPVLTLSNSGQIFNAKDDSSRESRQKRAVNINFGTSPEAVVEFPYDGAEIINPRVRWWKGLGRYNEFYTDFNNVEWVGFKSFKPTKYLRKKKPIDGGDQVG